MQQGGQYVPGLSDIGNRPSSFILPPSLPPSLCPPLSSPPMYLVASFSHDVLTELPLHLHHHNRTTPPRQPLIASYRSYQRVEMAST